MRFPNECLVLVVVRERLELALRLLVADVYAVVMPERWVVLEMLRLELYEVEVNVLFL